MESEEEVQSYDSLYLDAEGFTDDESSYINMDYAHVSLPSPLNSFIPLSYLTDIGSNSVGISQSGPSNPTDATRTEPKTTADSVHAEVMNTEISRNDQAIAAEAIQEDKPAGGEAGNPSTAIAEQTQTLIVTNQNKATPPTPPVSPIINGNEAPQFPKPSPSESDAAEDVSNQIIDLALSDLSSGEAKKSSDTPFNVDAISGPILEAAAIANAVAGIPMSNPSTPVSVTTPSELYPAPLAPFPETRSTAAGVSTSAPVKEEGKDNSSKSEDWNQRHVELLSAVFELENAKRQAASDALRLQLKVRDEEVELLRARVQTLEAELIGALSRPGTKNQVLIETIKQQHEELLSRARGMLFDKTKIVKNQELQIEALTAQVASLKDVNSITKDLLEIRNSEIKHLEEQLKSMETRFKAEKERHMLVLKKAESGQSINNDLRTEYEGQLKIFKELREMYDKRVQVLMAENKRLNDSLASTSKEPTEDSTA